ncbi:MAG TPA: hypothetical protein VGX45_09730, partial [Solirubrobacteraceae bacterium]|nr:hypothetical protein [Solirubrobacteraceae bacterium]
VVSERRSDPESYLSEIDRRLESIQGELQPGRARANQPPRRRGRTGPLAAILGRGTPARSEPAEPAPEPPPETPARSEGSTLEQEVRAIGELQERLISAIEGLVEAYEAPADERGAEANAVTLKAGPFADTDALRVFTEHLAELPGVEKVTVRGFEGADRAIVDVELVS